MTPVPLYSTESIKAIEKAYVAEQGIELYELMERAGSGAFEHIRRLYPDANHWLIATGSGNNAGDGLVVARKALEAGFSVTLVALKPYEEFAGDPQAAWEKLQQVSSELVSHQAFERLSLGEFTDLAEPSYEIVVDALLGTGVQGNLREEYAELITGLNLLLCPRVALDIPTGVFADSGCGNSGESGDVSDYKNQTLAFKADVTISFVALKSGQLMNHALEYQGRLICDDLGIRDVKTYGESPALNYRQLANVKDALPQRSSVGSKFDCGHSLIIGGGENLGGAAILSAKAAIKTGAGLVSCWLDSTNRSAALSCCPEVMWQGVDDLQIDGRQNEIEHYLLSQLSRFQVVALGPGLGRDEKARHTFEQVIRAMADNDVPLVLDADGLYWLAKCPLELPKYTIISPHAGEAVRLLNAQQEDVQHTGRIEPQLSVDTAYIEQNRIKVAEDLALKYNAICVLKGAGTIVSNGDRTDITAGAHPAMMTAGLGDVLTGLIASLIAQRASSHYQKGCLQKANLQEIAVLATELHFVAAKSAAGERHRGLLASEVIEELNVWINKL